MVCRRNTSITAGNDVVRLFGAHGLAQKKSWNDCFGVHPTASPSAYACDAATAFLAAISLAFWRIRSAKRGIWPSPRTRSCR